MPKIKALPPNTEGLQGADVLAMHNDSTDDTEKVSIEQVRDHFTWTPAEETWAYSSYSASTRIGVITVPSDATTKYSPGMRVSFSQTTGGTKYGIIHAVSSTTLSVFMQSGKTLANETITTPVFSQYKAPFSFPLDPLNWQIITSDTSSDTQTITTAWQNTVVSLTLGAGVWDVKSQGLLRVERNAGIGMVGQFGITTTSAGTPSAQHQTAQGDWGGTSFSASGGCTVQGIFSLPSGGTVYTVTSITTTASVIAYKIEGVNAASWMIATSAFL